MKQRGRLIGLVASRYQENQARLRPLLMLMLREVDFETRDLDSTPAPGILKALYLRDCNQLCFAQLPKFKWLQIVVFERAAPMDDCLNHQMIENIFVTRNLLVLDLGITR